MTPTPLMKKNAKMRRHFDVRYRAAFPDEPETISRSLYGRRKWQILRSMPLDELVCDYGEVVGLTAAAGRTAFLRALRRMSWVV